MRKNEILRNFEGKKFLIRKPSPARSRCPQVCFHFQIKKTCLFQYLFFRVDPFQDVSFQTISFSKLVLLYYILFNICLCWPSPLQKQLKVHFFQCKPDIIYETTDIKRQKHMRHPDIKNLWDTCRNCISTSVLNCPFSTLFHTISGHLIGHLIFQHKTRKHSEKKPAI